LGIQEEKDQIILLIHKINEDFEKGGVKYSPEGNNIIVI
jgi:hypothetical protein